MEPALILKKGRTQKKIQLTKNPHENTKERLMRSAKTLFAEKGFNGTTVKEIAAAAGVNISLVSYHFNGKEGLYRACLEQLGRARLAVAERILQNPNSAEEFRIRFLLFIEDFFMAHLEEPELSQIVMRECDMKLMITRDIFRNTFLKCFDTLVGFFTAAQAKSILRKDLNVEILTRVVFGSLVHLTQKDQLNEFFYGKSIRDKKYRQNVIHNFLSFFLNGCFANSSSFSKKDF